MNLSSFEARCSQCGRLEYFADDLTNGVCNYCTPNPDRDLVLLISENFDKPDHTFSTREYRRAFLYLWNTLNPALRPMKR